MSETHSSNVNFRRRFLDRFRLQFLQDGDWKAGLATSGLPENVQAVIGQVVQQTGLLRFEKSEIATELIHHFQDGHERGQSYLEIIDDFGPPEVASSLFRSSKLRSRPMSVKALRGSVAVSGGSLLGYLLLQLFFHSVKPNPSVDYTAKLNETVTSVPAEHQAWPHYRDLWIKYGLSNGGDATFSEIYIDDEYEDDHGNIHEETRLVRASDDQWAEAIAKLDSMPDLLDAWRKHGQLPDLGTPLHVDRDKYSDEDLKALFPEYSRVVIDQAGANWIDDFDRDDSALGEEATQLLKESTMGILLPHIHRFRTAGDLLRVDTRRAIIEGDRKRALVNIKTVHGLANQVADVPFYVCTLAGYAVHGRGFATVEEILPEHPGFFTDDQLTELRECVSSLKLA